MGKRNIVKVFTNGARTTNTGKTANGGRNNNKNGSKSKSGTTPKSVNSRSSTPIGPKSANKVTLNGQNTSRSTAQSQNKPRRKTQSNHKTVGTRQISSSSTSSSGIYRRSNNNSLNAVTALSTVSSISTASTVPIDPSQTNFPYDIRLNGFSSLISTVKKSTEKVQKMLMNECDVILECRTCRNLFRSIPNYISHKETFCTDKFHPMTTQGFSQLIQHNPSAFEIQHHFPIENSKQTTATILTKGMQNFNQKSMRLEELLCKLGPTVETATRPPSSLLTDIVEVQDQLNDKTIVPAPEQIHLRLDPINSKHNGIVFQKRIASDPSICDTTTPISVRELKASDTAVLDGDGKIMYVGAAGVVQDIVTKVVSLIEKKNEAELKRTKMLNCEICLTQFDTVKSLRTHTRTHSKPKKVNASGILDKGEPLEAAAESTESIKLDNDSTSEEDRKPRPKSSSILQVLLSSATDLEVEKKPKKITRKGDKTATATNSCRDLLPRTPPPKLSRKENHSSPSPQPETDEKSQSSSSSSALTKHVIAAGTSRIPSIPTSPIFSFKSGRSTNNSFSASLNAISPVKLVLAQLELSPELATAVIPPPVRNRASLPNLTRAPVRTRKPYTSPKRTRPSTRGNLAAEANIKRLKLATGHQSPTMPKSTSPNKPKTPLPMFTCLKCHLSFANMQRNEVYLHLAECTTGNLKFALAQYFEPPDSTNKWKSSIQIRHDYGKTSPSPTRTNAIPLPSPLPKTTTTPKADDLQILFKQNGRVIGARKSLSFTNSNEKEIKKFENNNLMNMVNVGETKMTTESESDVENIATMRLNSDEQQHQQQMEAESRNSVPVPQPQLIQQQIPQPQCPQVQTQRISMKEMGFKRVLF